MVLLGASDSITQDRKQLIVRQDLNTVFPTMSENHTVTEVLVQVQRT
jgi:hypothetical protein